MEITRNMRIRRNSTSDSVVGPTFELCSDLVFEILIRLPVKFLIRFKSVCKTWRQLIEDPSFMKEQHGTMSKRVNLNPAFGSILAITRHEEIRICIKWLRSRDKVNSNQNLNVVFCNYDWIVGISNGLVWNVSPNSSESIICNPTTRHTRVIPQFSLPISSSRTITFYGISFADDEYKLFVIVHSTSWSKLVVRAETYSVSTNLWRLIDVKIGEYDGRLDESYEKMAVVINDVFYWGAFNGNQYMVTYFDMKSYLCGVMKGPEFFETGAWQIIDYKGELCLTNCLHTTRFHMWSLNATERTWTMTLRVEGLALQGPLGDGSDLICLGRDSNGNFAMKRYISSSNYRFFMYNPESQVILYLSPGNLVWHDVFLYTESFLSV